MRESFCGDLEGLAADLATVLTQALVAARPEIDAARAAGGDAAAVARRILTGIIEGAFDQALQEYVTELEGGRPSAQ